MSGWGAVRLLAAVLLYLVGAASSQPLPLLPDQISKRWLVCPACARLGHPLRGAWCAVEPDSCPRGSTPAGADWDYCPPATTLSGCKCARNYTFMNQTFHGTCNNVDADPLGQWCVVEPGTCPSAARAHGGSAAADYDYCQVG